MFARRLGWAGTDTVAGPGTKALRGRWSVSLDWVRCLLRFYEMMALVAVK